MPPSSTSPKPSPTSARPPTSWLPPSPGPVQTERWDNLQRQQAEAAGQDLQGYIKEQSRGLPLGRIALPEEVADLVCLLASARASFLTGIAIILDGGISRGVYL